MTEISDVIRRLDETPQRQRRDDTVGDSAPRSRPGAPCEPRWDLHANNLVEQIKALNRCLDGWFEHGITPSAYCAWRIVVLLKKSQHMDIERDFLIAWCRHFQQFEGTKFQALAQRAAKRLRVDPLGAERQQPHRLAEQQRSS